jgi:acetyl/propionyl-CoA carboxylase alpha subunit
VKYIVAMGETRVTVDVEPDAVTVTGRRIPASLADIEGTPVRMVTIGDRVHRVVVRRRESKGRYVLWIDGYTYDVEALDERTRTIRDLTAEAAGPTGPRPLVAPMPGLIVRVQVGPGDTVRQGLVVMEAMKMENELRSSGAGRVTRVAVTPGAAVEKGAILIELE